MYPRNGKIITPGEPYRGTSVTLLNFFVETFTQLPYNQVVKDLFSLKGLRF